MENDELRILEIIRRPRTRVEIAKATDLSREAVSKVIRKLEKKGLIVSRGTTAARRHMTLAAAIEVLFGEVSHLSRGVKVKTTDPSWI